VHQPVLLTETVDLLRPVLDEGGTWIDCTLGLGGHAAAILAACPQARLLAIDRDPAALAEARKRLADSSGRIDFVEAPFSGMERWAGELGIGKVQGIFADLGVSSLQLDDAERGFSFRHDAPLDMRMGRPAGQAIEADGEDQEEELTARVVVNEYPEAELARIFMEYGEEAQARRIARGIGRKRAEKPIETTGELARLIEGLKPQDFRPREGKKRVHPATQVFQALRIEVNQELEQLEQLLDQATRLLESEGRLVVISYHSLEDRMVKHTLRDLASGEIEPITGRPRAETQVLEVLTRRPIRPSEQEVAGNPRARSARLRAARRL
jgi:16S rRNA (cytosine1402-N4)-methyltransferase